MESRSETLRATDVVNKGQGDGFSVRADNLQIWLCDRIRATSVEEVHDHGNKAGKYYWVDWFVRD